jgi:hypothetical protein
MMYPYMTLNDGTEITHSDYREQDEFPIEVYFERANNNDRGFDNAKCFLPGYVWKDVSGFNDEEIAYFQEIVESGLHLIVRFSKDGGLENAANL